MRLVAQGQHTQQSRCRAIGGSGFRYRARGIPPSETCTNEAQQYRHRNAQRAAARPSRRGMADSCSLRQPSTEAATDLARSPSAATLDPSISPAEPSDLDPAVPANAAVLDNAAVQSAGRVPRQSTFSPTYRQFDLSSHVNKRRVRANWKVAHFAEIWTLAKNKCKWRSSSRASDYPGSISKTCHLRWPPAAAFIHGHVTAEHCSTAEENEEIPLTFWGVDSVPAQIDLT